MTPNVLIVESRYCAHVADALLDGAMAALEQAGAQFQRISVPGALEIPAAILFAAHAGEGAGISYDGYVALGCVIHGNQFEIVSRESARGLMELGLRHALCIGNGILAVDNEEQGMAEASRSGHDKGGDAARACLALIAVRAKLGAHR